MDTLQSLCRTNDVAEKDGIQVSKTIASKTVWDKLAAECRTDEVVEAVDKASTAEQTIDQIAHVSTFLTPDTILLDYGCGYGRVAKYLLPDEQLSGYVGLDSAYGMLRLFKDRHESTPAEQTTPVLFLNANISDTALRDRVIDVAVVSGVLQHNHKSMVKQSMSELARVMKSGGTVLVYGSFPRMITLLGLQGQVNQCVLNMFGRPYKNGPVRYYTAREVARLFANFTEVDLVPVGYAVLPTRLFFLPQILNSVWRAAIANPANSLLEKITPQFLKCYFAVHLDVIAKR